MNNVYDAYFVAPVDALLIHECRHCHYVQTIQHRCWLLVLMYQLVLLVYLAVNQIFISLLRVDIF